MKYRNRIIKSKVEEWFKNHPSFEEFGENGYLSEGVKVIDTDGYKYILNPNNSRNNSVPERFYINNPFTIDNIKLYLSLTNSNLILASKEYQGNNKRMKWKCFKNHTFTRTWDEILTGHITCPFCADIDRHDKVTQDYIKRVHNLGYNFITVPKTLIITSSIDIIDKNGYKYSAYLRSLLRGSQPQKFNTNNKYTIQNINHFFELSDRKNYFCNNDEYFGNTKPLKIRHKRCNQVYTTDLTLIQEGQRCPYCYGDLVESFHASLLKQVFKHEYPDTVLEDPSCINPNTGYSLPTDIVNHELNIAIEIQSSFHDKEVQKIKDKIKKDYWINRGYSFFAPDIRDYSPIELVQLFFSEITIIPEYFIPSFSKTIDVLFLQKELDNGKSLKQISRETGIKHGTLQNAVKDHRLTLPDDYKKKHLNWRPIVMVDDNNIIIKEFSTMAQANKEGYKSGTVIRVLKKKQNKSYGYKWFYKDEFVS